MAKDRTRPRTSVEKSIVEIDEYLATHIATDPFVNVPPSPQFTGSDTAAWRERLAEQVRETIRPASARYRDELSGEVLPRSRPEEKTGVRWLPDEEEVHARAIRRDTSLDMAPLDIHNISLEEIARLDGKYRVLGSRVLGTSNLSDIYDRLRNDPALRFENAERIVAGAQNTKHQTPSAPKT